MFACRAERGLAEGRLSDPVPVVPDAPTVGNRPDGLVGETLVPASGSVPLGAGLLGLVIGVEVGVGAAAETTSVAVPEYELAPAAVAAAESCHCVPTVAVAGTSTVASISSAWFSGKVPTVHVVPFVAGHTRNDGVPMFAFSTFVVTRTLLLVGARALQTQIAKLAKLPGAT